MVPTGRAKWTESVIFTISLFTAWCPYQPKMECQYTKPNIFALQSICMEVPISTLCFLVHEPPYQTIVVYCNSVICHGSLCAWTNMPFSTLEWGSPQYSHDHRYEGCLSVYIYLLATLYMDAVNLNRPYDCCPNLVGKMADDRLPFLACASIHLPVKKSHISPLSNVAWNSNFNSTSKPAKMTLRMLSHKPWEKTHPTSTQQYTEIATQ